MKTFLFAAFLFVNTGCASLHSPYDLYTWCRDMGSSRLTSIGAKAHDPANCEKELEEDLADRTPKILYAARDVALVPLLTARGLWILLGMTEPPF
jgi:hypothetical protein